MIIDNMKISILFQPRDSGITNIFQENWWYRTEYRKWNWEIEKDTVIQRVKKEELEKLIKHLKTLDSQHKVLICTAIENRKSEMERIEKLILNYE